MSNYNSEIIRLENERKTAKVMIVAGIFLFLPLAIYGVYKNSKLKRQIQELKDRGYSGETTSGNGEFVIDPFPEELREENGASGNGPRRFGEHRGTPGQPRRFGEHRLTGTTHETSSTGGNNNNNNFSNSADKFKNR